MMLVKIDLAAYVTRLVAAFVSHNSVAPAALPLLIANTYSALKGLYDQSRALAPRDPPVPAVPINRSIFADFLICLEDGKRRKLLKRYLRTAYNLSPDEYRAKWGLPADYPMAAPAYAEARSKMAKNNGLGNTRRTARTAKRR